MEDNWKGFEVRDDAWDSLGCSSCKHGGIGQEDERQDSKTWFRKAHS